MIKRLVMAILIAFSVTCTAIAADLSFVATVSPTGVVKVEGKGNAGYLYVEVYKNESDRIKNSGTPAVADVVEIDSDGDFILTWKIDENQTGEYKVVLGNTGINSEESARTKTIYFATQPQLERAITAVNAAADANALKTALNTVDSESSIKYSDMLQITADVANPIYINNETKVLNYVLGTRGTGFADQGSIATAIKQGIGAVDFCNSTSTNFDDNLKKYASVFDVSRYYNLDDATGKYVATNLYTGLKNEMAYCAKTVIGEYIASKSISGPADITKILKNIEAVASVNIATVDNVISVIHSYSEVFEGIDSKRFSLNEGNYETISTKIFVYEATDRYMTVESIETSYNTAYNGLSTSRKPSSGKDGGVSKGGISGGSSGGGLSISVGGGSADTSVQPNTNLNEKFKDLDSVEWAKPYINRLADMGIINGKGDGLFAPDEIVTREEVAKMIAVAINAESTEEVAEFTDVEQGEWYAPYINTATSIGLIKGYLDGSFGVGKAITREEAAVFIYRALLYMECDIPTDKEIQFADVKEISEFAADAVKACYNLEIVQGYENNMFLPNNLITRAECAKIIYCLTKMI